MTYAFDSCEMLPCSLYICGSVLQISIKVAGCGWCKCYGVAPQSGPYLWVKSHSGLNFAGNMSPLVRKPKAPLQDVDNCMQVFICDMIQAKETTSAWSLLC